MTADEPLAAELIGYLKQVLGRYLYSLFWGVCTVPVPHTYHAPSSDHFTTLSPLTDALEIRNGPGHAEVKMCRGTPVLVEVGARCHGGEGVWVPVVDLVVG